MGFLRRFLGKMWKFEGKLGRFGGILRVLEGPGLRSRRFAVPGEFGGFAARPAQSIPELPIYPSPSQFGARGGGADPGYPPGMRIRPLWDPPDPSKLPQVPQIPRDPPQDPPDPGDPLRLIMDGALVLSQTPNPLKSPPNPQKSSQNPPNLSGSTPGTHWIPSG